MGFTTIYECHNPTCFINGVDKRITLLAVKGKSCVLISNPDLNNKEIPDHSEKRNSQNTARQCKRTKIQGDTIFRGYSFETFEFDVGNISGMMEIQFD